MILEDYLLSTDFRDPRKENGEVDLEAAAKTNAFAAMMLRYKAAGATARPNPLVTAGGTPFLQATFEEIDRRYGSVGAYLEEALGLTAAEQERLRALYTEG
jgi:protein-tyrosine phosphatase